MHGRCGSAGDYTRGGATLAIAEEDQLAQIQAMYGGEADFVRMAAEEPSFAGYHIEDSGLIALTSSEERRAAVGEAIRRQLVVPKERR